MMAAEHKMDMSLTDIIRQDKQRQQQQRGGGGGRARGGGRGGGDRGPSGVHHFGGPAAAGGGYGVRNRGRAPPPPAHGRPRPYHRHDDSRSGSGGGGWNSRGSYRAAETAAGGSLVITNLPYNVTDADIKTLFSDVGVVKKVTIEFRGGRSIGVADVDFETREAALQAMQKYNHRTVDGNPMRIQFIEPEPQERSSPQQQQQQQRWRHQPRHPPKHGGARFNRFSRFEGGAAQDAPRSHQQRHHNHRRSQWLPQGPSKKRLDAQMDDMMDTS